MLYGRGEGESEVVIAGELGLCRGEGVLDGGRGGGRVCGALGGDDPHMRVISCFSFCPLSLPRGSGAGGLL